MFLFFSVTHSMSLAYVAAAVVAAAVAAAASKEWQYAKRSSKFLKGGV